MALVFPDAAWACDASGKPEEAVARLAALSWGTLGSGITMGSLYAVKSRALKKTDSGASKKIRGLQIFSGIAIVSGLGGLWLKNILC